jgi:NADH-quinone oxidoreductase subunit K
LRQLAAAQRAAAGQRTSKATAGMPHVDILSAPTLSHYLILGAILFAISMAGIFLNRKNVIILLMAIELMLLSVNMNFIAFSSYMDDMTGQVFVFFILTVAAAESAIGLAILVLLFRNVGSIDVEDLDRLRG